MNKSLKIKIAAAAIAAIGTVGTYLFINIEATPALQAEEVVGMEPPASVVGGEPDAEAAVEKKDELKADTDEPQPMKLPDTPSGVPLRSTETTKPEMTKEKAKPVVSASSADWRGPTLEDLEKLRSENALLEAQLKNAELKTKIAAQGGAHPVAPSNGESQHSHSGEGSRGPRVLMIAGGENNYRASVLMPSGLSINAGVGTVLPGYGVVSSVTPNEVVVGKGDARKAFVLPGGN